MGWIRWRLRRIQRCVFSLLTSFVETRDYECEWATSKLWDEGGNGGYGTIDGACYLSVKTFSDRDIICLSLAVKLLQNFGVCVPKKAAFVNSDDLKIFRTGCYSLLSGLLNDIHIVLLHEVSTLSLFFSYLVLTNM